ncbi:MAG: hypothetical protein JW941_05420, partial [Candidatus Coatesbacteria bacterium]|nr:hypothetical protein [Candidatus Coatesbacteria bacterium]
MRSLRSLSMLLISLLFAGYFLTGGQSMASVGYLLELDIDDSKYTNPMPQSPLKGYRIGDEWFSRAVVGVDLSEPDKACSFRVWSDQHEYTAEATSDEFGTCFFEFTAQYSGAQTEYHYQVQSAGESAPQRDFTILSQLACAFSNNGISWVNAPETIDTLPAVITVSLEVELDTEAPMVQLIAVGETTNFMLQGEKVGELYQFTFN